MNKIECMVQITISHSAIISVIATGTNTAMEDTNNTLCMGLMNTEFLAELENSLERTCNLKAINMKKMQF
jgi:hypothetical protein